MNKIITKRTSSGLIYFTPLDGGNPIAIRLRPAYPVPQQLKGAKP